MTPACSIQEICGSIPVGNGRGLVIDGGVPMSAWISSPDANGGCGVVPLQWEDDLDQFIASIPEAMHSLKWTPTKITVDVADKGLTLFPACYSAPHWTHAFVPISAARGTYGVDFAEYQPRSNYLYRVFRLTIQSAR